MSNSEPMGPEEEHKATQVPRVPARSGLAHQPSSTLSKGMAICEIVQQVLHQQVQRQHGQEGMKAEATITENTLPKLELAVMRMYFSMLLKVRRPSITPCSSTIRLFQQDDVGGTLAMSRRCPR